MEGFNVNAFQRKASLNLCLLCGFSQDNIGRRATVIMIWFQPVCQFVYILDKKVLLGSELKI
jgi:hypothetical protein